MIKTESKIASRNQIAKEDLINHLEEYTLRRVLKGDVWAYRYIKEIRERFGIYLGPSTVYPFLNDLEKEGYICSKDRANSRHRKVYKSVAFKTVERLKEIRNVKNENRRKMNNIGPGFLSIQVLEPIAEETL